MGDRLFLSATDLAHGCEPWSLKLGRTVSIADAAVSETNGTTDAQLVLSLSSAAPTPVTVSFTTGGGSASPGTDYTPAAGAVTFAPGATTAAIGVAVLGDALDEETETFGVQLGSTDVLVADGAGEARILDDDPRPALSVADCATIEGDTGRSACLFSIQLSAASRRTVSAGFATGGVTATAPADFLAASGTVAIAPGLTRLDVTVEVVGDALVERDETFRFDLDDPQNATAADGNAVGLIQDDDGASPARGELAHGTSATLPLGLSGGEDFRLAQAPFSSYEIVLDAVAGDGGPLGAAARLAANGVTVLQSSQPIGTGTAAGLAWENSEGVADRGPARGRGGRVRAGLCHRHHLPHPRRTTPRTPSRVSTTRAGR